MNFTIEEINLMCIYDTSSREILLNDLIAGLNDVYDREMISIFKKTIEKLEKLTDNEFEDIGFYVTDDFFLEDLYIGE